jgi:eukaryotic-like serine/threonine-protein kinase
VIAFALNSVSPIVPAAGGLPKSATTLDRSREERGHFFPYFLPDGRHFLYLAVSGKRENIGIYVGSLDSKDTKRLLDVQAEVRYAPPGYLLFVRGKTLIAQGFDATRLELSGDAIPIAEQVGSNSIFGDAMFSVSENGVLAYRGGAIMTGME